MSTNINDYPSCIKIPNTKQNHKTIEQYQTKESLPLVVQQKKIIRVNNALLSLANQIFGEEKWSYSITNQTLDFVDSAWDIYVVGCCTLVKVQLHSGIFREDMGYSVKKGSVKGEAIHCARLASYNDALVKVLCSFGGKIKTEAEELAKELSNSLTLPKNKLSPPVNHDINETKEKEKEKEKEEAVLENTSNVLCQEPEVSKTNVNNIPSSNNVNCMKNQLTSKPNIFTDQEDMNNKKLSIEEIIRQERKRKQMEKQMEYRRLMKEKELKKSNNL